jgi:hypothetical protein
MSDRKPPRVVVRFTATDGVDWTIYDTTWSRGKYHRRPHGDPTTTERVFVNANGIRRAYKFKPSDTRVFEEQALERQLGASKFLPTSTLPDDSQSLGPGERRTPTFQAERDK